MEEEWKVVENYPNYAVSNFGRVKSLDREIENHGAFGISKSFFKKGVILKTRTSKTRGLETGYYRVLLSNGGKPKNFCIHKLVAEAFIPNPDNKKEVDHIDTDVSNNCVNNLRWCTRGENVSNPKTKEKFLESLLKTKYKTSKYYYKGMTLHAYCSKKNINYYRTLHKIKRSGMSVEKAICLN